MRIARVFPRVTRATPVDDLVFTGPPPMFIDVDEIHISVTFTSDKLRAEWLAEQWSKIGPVKVGGVAYGDRGEDFIPGKYIRSGYTFTSRGCPERCWFCSVWKRDPQIRLLPIQEGWNILDDNLLACPEDHFRAVIAMLTRQACRVEFTGGLQAARLTDLHVDLLAGLKPKPVCFFAYDPGDKFETMKVAADKMLRAGFSRHSHRLRTFVLIGYPMDTFEKADARLRQMLDIGFTPYAMLWQPETPTAEKWRPAPIWKQFQRSWARPAIIHSHAHQVPDRPAQKLLIFP